MPDDTRWVVIRSSHVETGTTRTGAHTTLCGRIATGEVYESLPPGKSCEMCLRLLVKRQGQ